MFVSHLNAIKTLLSECAAFQTWTSSADASEALDAIILGRQAPPALTRYAILGPGEPTSWAADASGAGIAAGSMIRQARVTFVRFLEDGETTADFGYTFAATFLGVVENCVLQILEQRGTTATPEDSYLTAWSEDDQHMLPEDEDNAGSTPAYTRKGDTDTYGYMFTILFTWET